MTSTFGRQTVTCVTVALLFALSAWPQQARAQTIDDALRFSHRVPATGARMMGMSGAGLYAGIPDYTALLNNPAGLGYLSRSMAAGAFNTLSTLDESTFSVSGPSETAETDIRHTGLTNLAYLYKFPTVQGNLVIGASYNQVNPFERELSYSGTNPNNSISHFFLPTPDEYFIEIDDGDDNTPGTPDDFYVPGFRTEIPELAWYTYGIDFDAGLYEDGAAVPFWAVAEVGPLLQNERVTETGSIREVNLGGAAEAFKGVMAGLSANLSFGRYDFRRVFEEEDFQNVNDGSVVNGIPTVDFDFLRYTQGLESDLVGFNLRGGLTAEVASGLRAGLMLETPTFYNINEDYYTTLETWFDNGDYFNSEEEVPEVGFGQFEYRLVTPWRLGVGGTYNMGGLTVGADAEFVDWTQMRFYASTDEGYFDELNTDVRDQLNAVVNTRVGAEYWFSGFGVRAGFAYQPDPVERDPEDAVDHSKSYLSAGFGYRFAEQVQLDFGWIQERFEDRYVPYEPTAVLDEVGPGPLVLEDIVRNRFALGVRVFF